MNPAKFITVSYTQYCTYFTQMDMVTDKETHKKNARHKSGGAWLAFLLQALFDPMFFFKTFEVLGTIKERC